MPTNDEYNAMQQDRDFWKAEAGRIARVARAQPDNAFTAAVGVLALTLLGLLCCAVFAYGLLTLVGVL